MSNLSFLNKIIYWINSAFLLLLILSYLSPFINPSIFWPISFLGLLFPALYLINCLFLVYWLFKYKKQVFGNIIVLLFGLKYLSLFVGPSPKEITSQDNIMILSYNVRLFNYYKWIKKDAIEEKIVKFIKKQNADIICIQEYYNQKHMNILQYKYKHIGQDDKKNNWHMAIYSKYPQIQKGYITIDGKEKYNTCIYSDIVVNSDTIRVYNIHLASNWFNHKDYSFIENPNKKDIKKSIRGIIKKMKNSYKIRSKEVKIIKKHMTLSPYPNIVVGDFNDTPLSYAYNTIKKNLKDSFSVSGKGIGKSFIKIPGLRIDYILHDKALNSFNYKQYNDILSDHYPISCEIEITNP